LQADAFVELLSRSEVLALRLCPVRDLASLFKSLATILVWACASQIFYASQFLADIDCKHVPGDRLQDLNERNVVTVNPSGAMLILIAGPYRSGTNDDPALIRKNVQEMESYALPIFRAGHIPVLGEWLALPLVELAGSRKIGDDAFTEVFHPIATRLLEKCDAVLRVGGPSAGADEMVRVGRRLGLPIYDKLAEVPGVE